MSSDEPKVARRSLHRNSTMRSGRTIGEKREKLETASERAEAHKRIKRQQRSRVLLTIFGFALVAAVLVYLGIFLVGDHTESTTIATTVATYKPTIEVVDEDANATGGHISSRMREYIGMFEEDIRAYGYTPAKAVIPTGSIREVDFYLDGHPGCLKTLIDRDSAVTAEDADRMLRYLASQNITDWQYLDLRLDRQAYWK